MKYSDEEIIAAARIGVPENNDLLDDLYCARFLPSWRRFVGALPAPLDTTFVGGCYPTHYCTVCNAMWRQWRNGSWNLRSRQAGPCCAHGLHIVEMDTSEPGVGISQ